METLTVNKDIKVFCIKAKSFPEGVMDAHKSLNALVAFSENRNFFGISRPEGKSGIIYQAAVEEAYPAEAEKHKCPTLVLKKGKYLSITVADFKKDTESISNAFRDLLAEEGLDPQGYCVEWYMNDQVSVKCMIRLKD